MTKVSGQITITKGNINMPEKIAIIVFLIITFAIFAAVLMANDQSKRKMIMDFCSQENNKVNCVTEIMAISER